MGLNMGKDNNFVKFSQFDWCSELGWTWSGSVSNFLHSDTPFTRYNWLLNRLYSRFDNRLYHVNKHPTGCQTGLYNRFNSRLYTRYSRYQTSRLSNQLSNGFDNRLNVCIHDKTGCQTGLVWQPVWKWENSQEILRIFLPVTWSLFKLSYR